MWRKVLIGIGVAAPLLVVATAGIMRTVSHDANRWHVDPLIEPTPNTPNSYRVLPESGAASEQQPVANNPAPVWDLSVTELATSFDQAVRAEPGVSVLAGSADEGWVTYIQTSRLFAFPDYVSVKFLPVDDNRSTVAVFSRSRFGRSDFDANEKRVNHWVNLI